MTSFYGNVKYAEYNYTTCKTHIVTKVTIFSKITGSLYKIIVDETRKWNTI